MSSKNVDHGQNQPDDQPPKVFTVDHDSEATPDEESTPVVTPGEELVTHSRVGIHLRKLTCLEY